jgi:phosphoglycolate phosphatase
MIGGMNHPKKKKLVLFDIDGTLLTARQSGVENWKKRLNAAFVKAHNKPITFEIVIKDFNGMVDKQTKWKIAQMLGITRAEFEEKLPIAQTAFYEFLKNAVDTEDVMYEAIADARTLLEQTIAAEHIHVGLVTGNIERNAWLKLKAAGFDQDITFGAFGDNVDDRPALVKDALDRGAAHFGVEFLSTDVIVIGDTPHDIEAGKAHGTITIGVSTGMTTSAKELEEAGADLVVSSLMDPRVLALLEL